MNVAYLQCTLCSKTYSPDAVQYVCPDHGDDGILDVVYDYAAIHRETSPDQISRSQDFSIWRYWDLLPLSQRTAVPPLQVAGRRCITRNFSARS